MLDGLDDALIDMRGPIAEIQTQLRRLVDNITRGLDSVVASRDEALELISTVQADLDELKVRLRLLEKLVGVEWDPK